MKATLVNNIEQVVGEVECPDECLIISYANALFARLPSAGLVKGATRIYKQSPYFVPDYVFPVTPKQ